MPSSVIRYYQYYPESQRLRVHFVSGLVYDYTGIPKDVFEKFEAALSKGQFLNKEIKPNFSFERITE